METHHFDIAPNTVLNVLYVEEPPFVNNIDLDNDFHTGHYNGPGIVMDILKIVGERHGLKYNFTKSPKDANYGQKLPDGNWNGMIGMLHRNEVDILAGAVIVNDERKEAIDFTTAFMRTASGMLIRSPDQFIDNRFLIVTAPLEWQVWALIALSIVISGFIFKGVCAGLRKLNMEVQFSLLDCVWIFYAIFVQQDLSRLPSCAATRTMLSFWWLASLSICGFFTGNMVALFAVTRSILPFNTRDDMVEKVKEYGYRVVLQNTSDVRMNFIRDSGLKVFNDLWYEMNSKGKWINVSTLEEGIQTVVDQKKLVFVGAKEALEALASQICTVTTLDGDLIPVWYAIGLRKNSEYITVFNDVINKLAENGFVDKWLHDAQMMQAYYRGTKCNTSLGAGIGTGGNIDIAGDAIPIEKAQGVFWLLLAGIVLGMSSLIIEKVWRLVRPQHQNASLPTVSQKQKPPSSVQVISVAPVDVRDSHQDAVESVESYKPKAKTDAFIKTVTQSQSKGEEKKPDKNEPFFENRYSNFGNNVYGNNYVSAAAVIDNGELGPHAVNEENDGLKHRTGGRIQIIR